MQPREYLSIHLLQHGFAVQWIRTGPVVAEVHVKLSAPRCVIRTSLTVVLVQADLRCDMPIIDWPNYSLFNHFDVCGNHCPPSFCAGSAATLLRLHLDSRGCVVFWAAALPSGATSHSTLA